MWSGSFFNIYIQLNKVILNDSGKNLRAEGAKVYHRHKNFGVSLIVLAIFFLAFTQSIKMIKYCSKLYSNIIKMESRISRVPWFKLYQLTKSQTTKKENYFICITFIITCQPSSMNKDRSNPSKTRFGCCFHQSFVNFKNLYFWTCGNLFMVREKVEVSFLIRDPEPLNLILDKLIIFFVILTHNIYWNRSRVHL